MHNHKLCGEAPLRPRRRPWRRQPRCVCTSLQLQPSGLVQTRRLSRGCVRPNMTVLTGLARVRCGRQECYVACISVCMCRRCRDSRVCEVISMCDPAMCAVASELKRQSCRLLALEFSVAVSDDPMLQPSSFMRCRSDCRGVRFHPVNGAARGSGMGTGCGVPQPAPTRDAKLDFRSLQYTVYLHRLSVDGTILPISVSRSDRRARRGGRGQRDSSLSTCTPRSPNYFTDLSSRTARNPIGRALQKSPSMCPGASPATAASASCAIRWHSCQSGIISKGCST